MKQQQKKLSRQQKSNQNNTSQQKTKENSSIAQFSDLMSGNKSYNLDIIESGRSDLIKRHNFNPISPLKRINDENTYLDNGGSFRESPFQPKRNAAIFKSQIQDSKLPCSDVKGSKPQARTPTRNSGKSQMHSSSLLGVSQSEYRHLLQQYQNLQKNHEKLDKQYQQSQKEAVKYRTLNEQNEKELKVVQISLIKIKDEKSQIESELKQVKDYSRKLENKLIAEFKGSASGQNGNALTDLINQQREQIAKLKSDKEKCDGILEGMYQKCQQQTEDIKILTKALDLKVEDINKSNGQISRRSILDQLKNEQLSAQNHEQVLILQNQVSNLKQMIQGYQLENEELKVIRDSNNQELLRLEQEIHYLQSKNQSLAAEKEQLGKEKNTLLDYINEINQNNQKRIDDFEEEMKSVVDTNRQLQRKLEDLQYQINHKTSEAEKLKQENERLAYQTSQSEREFKLLKEEIHSLRHQLQQNHQTSVNREELYKLESENQVLKERLNSVLNESKSLKADMEGYLQNIKKLEFTVSQLKREDSRHNSDRFAKENHDLRVMNEELRRQGDEAKMQQQNLLQIQRQLEEKNTLLQKQVENLIASKKLLQKTLSEQMNFRQKDIIVNSNIKKAHILVFGPANTCSCDLTKSMLEILICRDLQIQKKEKKDYYEESTQLNKVQISSVVLMAGKQWNQDSLKELSNAYSKIDGLIFVADSYDDQGLVFNNFRLAYQHLNLSSETPVLINVFGYSDKPIQSLIDHLKVNLRNHQINSSAFYFSNRTKESFNERYRVPFDNFILKIGIYSPIVVDYKELAATSYTKKMQETFKQRSLEKSIRSKSSFKTRKEYGQTLQLQQRQTLKVSINTRLAVNKSYHPLRNSQERSINKSEQTVQSYVDEKLKDFEGQVNEKLDHLINIVESFKQK